MVLFLPDPSGAPKYVKILDAVAGSGTVSGG
jgi:hypothetical protein